MNHGGRDHNREYFTWGDRNQVSADRAGSTLKPKYYARVEDSAWRKNA